MGERDETAFVASSPDPGNHRAERCVQETMKEILFLVVSALLTAACGPATGGGDTTASTTTTTAPPTTTTVPRGRADLVLRITDEGGFVPLEYNLARIPRFSVYSDGTIYYGGAVPAVYPGPLLPNVLAARMGADEYTTVLDQIARLGLPEVVDEIDDSAMTRVADASTAIATYYDESGSHRYGVYALEMGGFGDPRPAELNTLILLLDEITATLPAEPYLPAELQVWAGPAQNIDPQFAIIDPWAFAFDPAALPVQPFGYACTVLDGTSAVDALTLFSAAHQQTFWDRDGVTWQLIPVPLMPGLPGCVTD